jgi:hypothetical protein
MDPYVMKAWAGALAPYLAFFTAFWAILTYRRGKTVEVARLQKQIFDDVYLSGKFDAVRHAIDLDFATRMAPILDIVAKGDETRLGKEDRALLLELDNFLNLIEYVLYLEQDKKLMTKDDRKTLLAYWIGLVCDHRPLRDYVSRYGYERLDKCVSAEGAAR